MQQLMPFIILLILAVIFSYIPMEETMKKVGFLLIGIAAILMLLKYLQLF